MENNETKSGIWFNPQNKIWDFLVIAPIIAFPLIFILMFGGIFGLIATTPTDSSAPPLLFFPFMILMMLLIFAVSILGILSQIYAYINIFRSTKFADNEKVLWAVGVFFFAFVIVPVVHFMYFRKERK